VTISCKPASGAVFAINRPGQSTTVQCTAADRAGNAATASFTVHVNGAAEQIRNLDKLIASLSIPRGHELLLRAKLGIALIALSVSRAEIACGALGSFADHLKKARGGLTPARPHGCAERPGAFAP
jgi:hypothetical protein